MKKRVFIAGFGDTGLLVAINLGSDYDIVGVSPKPCLVSGQELGTRLTRPQSWKRDYLNPYRRYKNLDHVEAMQGLITAIDPASRTVTSQRLDGSVRTDPYDVLVLSPGVTNGFWRNNKVEDLQDIEAGLVRHAGEIEQAGTIAIVGGGATGVSVSANIAAQYPDKQVHFFYSEEQPLPGYHPRVRQRLEEHLRRAGVNLHPQHRAVIPEGFALDTMTRDPLHWSSGQAPFAADLVLWAVGNMRPNSSFIPAAMLDERGFVLADQYLRVPGHDNVFTVGDIAASDPNRSSARNWGYRLVAHNIKAHLAGRDQDMKSYAPPHYRWGSILGVQGDGLRVFQPDGGNFRFPRWSIRSLLFPLAVHRGIYKGVRKIEP